MLKGKACMNCRRRKIRCDGEKPSCSQCARSNGTFEDCEYPGEGPTQTQLLEERISRLQSRIQELEGPNEIFADPVALHNPYHITGIADISQTWPAPNFNCSTPGPVTSRATSRASSKSPNPRPSVTTLQVNVQEPPPDAMPLLTDAFYRNCTRFGFFLNIRRFHKSFQLQLPIGHHARPSPALLSAVYLWGIHLSPELSKKYDQRVYLRHASYHLSQDLSGSHPHRVLHGVQAEVLLSYYYLKNGKVLEGSCHANAAVSLSLSAGLHRIRTPGSSVAARSQMRLLESNLSRPADGIEEGEHIDAFWAVLVLNNYWVAIQECHSMFYDLQNVGIDTPWPMNTAEYELHLMPQESSGTLKRFLENTEIEGLSVTALHAKAAVLLERATIHRTQDKSFSLHSDAFIRLDSLIDQFRNDFPLDYLDSQPLSKETLLVTQMMAHVATIKLHQPLSDGNKNSRHKALFSALSIANFTKDLTSTGSHQLDPIVGFLWNSACEVLMHEISRSIANSSQWAVPLRTILLQMARFSSSSALMKFLVTRLQKNYAVAMTIL